MLTVVFVGAGGIHFGGGTGPWDHSSRLEKLDNLQFVAIVDPDTTKASAVLERKLLSEHRGRYSQCKVYPDIADFFLHESKPDIILLGIPPGYRGSDEKGKDLELQVVQNGINLFVEKPLSIVHCDKFSPYAERVEEARRTKDVLVSVGYMFRYHDGFVRMKELIAAHGGKVMLFNARFYMAYSEKNHQYWWDEDKSGGPVVEQATHFYDIARFLGGDIKLESVDARYLKETDDGGAGHLHHVPGTCETSIPPSKRVPRAHIATWRFQDGGLGTLSHVVALHGQTYETSIDVLLDGLRITLYEPYTTKCKLFVRKSGSDEETVEEFGAADPYMGELRTFVNSLKSRNSSNIASSYEDAEKSYRFSWAVRLAAEASSK